MRLFSLLLLTLSTYAYADTIEHYMNIASNIPKMEIKADPQAQAWARSARNVLLITSESIAETLTQVNKSATNLNKPLFCMPAGTLLDGKMLDNLIQETYQAISSQQRSGNMTVSEVALFGLSKKFPCNNLKSRANQMEHMSALLND